MMDSTAKMMDSTATNMHRLVRKVERTLLAAATLGALLLSALLCSSSAFGDVGATIIERCTHGQSLSGYSQADYRKALQEVTAEVNEYSECSNLIRKAELAAAGSRGGPGGPSGTTTQSAAPIPPPTTAEQAELQQAVHHAGSQPVQLGSQAVVPGVVHADIASAVNALPTPLLAMLAFLLTIVLLLLGRTVRDRVNAHRSG
jgi:hypothetical protein